jgi:hypothetical protein
LDDAYVMMIRQANLDAMGGRAVATIEAHASAILQAVLNCRQKTPTTPPRGPMPMSDSVGIGLAMELLFHSTTPVPRIKGIYSLSLSGDQEQHSYQCGSHHPRE